MRNILIGSACLIIGACSSPLQPSKVAAAVELAHPLHHNVPATLPDGRIMWLCATQLRAYTNNSGVTTYEEDHYLQFEQCPVIPIQ